VFHHRLARIEIAGARQGGGDEFLLGGEELGAAYFAQVQREHIVLGGSGFLGG
jgi:hypothetical protein